VFDLKKIAHTNLPEMPLLSYIGQYTLKLLEDSLLILEQVISEQVGDLRIRKKAVNIFIELFQNIHHHSTCKSEKPKEISSNNFVFHFGKSQNGYQLFVGNFISNEALVHLEEKIKQVNALPRKELKEKYRETLQNGMISQKGGAGLGLIDVAYRSANPIAYELSPYNANCSFILLKILINPN